MSAALVALTCASGTLLAWRLHPRWPWLVRLAAGAALGSTLTGLGGVTGAWLCDLPRGALPGALLAALAPLLMLLDDRTRAAFARAVHDGLQRARDRAFWTRARRLDAALAGVGVLALLAVVERGALYGPDGIATGVTQNYGDLPFHLAVASGFALDAPFPPEHPELAGARLTYPYLVDFVAALWSRAGLPLARAFRWQMLLLAPATLVLLWHWALCFTRERGAARLTPAIVLSSGGLGFVLFLGRLADEGPALLLALTRDYTIDGDGPLRWGNAVLTLLIPQRGFLLALPLMLLVFALWAEALTSPAHGDERDAHSRPEALLGRAGLVTGLLPLAHAHSFTCSLAVAAALALLFPLRRAWAAFFAGALALGLPQVLLLAHGSALQAGHFVGLQFGWDRGAWNPIVFWLINTGALLPLWLAALLWRGRTPLLTQAQRRLHAPFVLLFVVPNLLRLSPWIWDNVKFLFVWFVAAAPLVALALARLGRATWPRRAAAAALLGSLTAAGALDLWRVASRQVWLPIVDAAGLHFARDVHAATPPGARLLHWPTHDAPTLLAGRASVLGYPGHVWSQGLEAGTREADVTAFYAEAPRGVHVLRRYAVDFVVEGPRERREARALRERLSAFPVLVESGPYRLYDVRAARASGPEQRDQ